MAVMQREYGRRTLLHQIRRAGRIPRIELADLTGISRATVTTITAELLSRGLIEEVQRDESGPDSRRGRPRVDLKIRGAAHLLVGVKVSHHKLSLVLLDFEGEQLAAKECDLPAPVNAPEALADAIRDAVAHLATTAGRRAEEISGVGVGIAGIVEATDGFVHWSPSLSVRNVDLGALLTRTLGTPCFIDNDANLVAVAEQTFGLGREHKDFLVVTIESGVGLGMVIGGALYRGTRGCGAEFGHTKVQLNGALCRCGQRGCLEAYVADYALLREATLVSGLPPTGDPGTRIETLLDAARTGDATARSILDRAGQIFAMGLANLVNIFDPELIILAGEQMQLDHLYADAVIEAMRKSIVQVDKPPPEVVVHKWGDLMWARGAAAYALEQVSELALDRLDEDAA
ncbi:ROK family transcriptional regulator [Ruegeria pomeroyi]|nr:ROK family transcriptional regulator [Ruegeria pomeroyi]NVK95762.1 ROK family transcriptional regulator [Ruegeria pomeroyi]NVL01163.1 ROK family transcriptional regulator [Ruegeria pomeroyi]QWV07741.1 ROK family transcriptional regulator [Ruegeria pomeroyi]HCE69980.1 ROK family transcriptional regulator [Ruegeria sp.]